MADFDKYRQYGAALTELLSMPTAPLALKLLKTEEEIQPGAVRPKKDRQVHYSLCQVFALARREGLAFAMFREDHWCWAPLIAFGLVEFHEEHESYPIVSRYLGIADEEAAKKFLRNFPRLEYGQYAGLVVGPLTKANYEPDIILIYTDSYQLKKLLLAVKSKRGELVTSTFDAIDSCVYSTIPVLKNGEYRITFPDPGDIERALAEDGEIIFSLPKDRLDEIISGLEFLSSIGMGKWQRAEKIEPDHPRPPFYRELFRIWGLDTEDES
ncbi:MAG: DUF169 domain-containing protein [Firmicutes bacterium]|nr:DUF169 domain-containing protein [Bacillota bacterium]